MPAFFRYIIIAILASLLFFPFLGNVHLFDWDEINFAECAREMIVSDDYLRVQIDFKPFWEKPPFFIWLQVISMKLFGINEYAARFPNALVGVVTLLSLFYIGKRVANQRMATWWVVLYTAAWLPHLYFKSGIIDPVFNLFIFLAFYQTYAIRQSGKKILHSILAGMFLGVAVLTKGPVAILVAILSFVVYIVWSKGLNGYRIGHLLLIALAAFSTTALWFGLEVVNHGWWFVNEFITYQVRLLRTEDASHGGPFFYHFVVLLLGCFPASIFLFQYGTKKTPENDKKNDFARWMWILFWVVLILFSLVKTKIVHYSSLCYFPLTYLAAWQVHRLAEGKAYIKKRSVFLWLFIGSILAIAITALPLVGIYKEKLIPLIKDPFAVGNLQANVSWSLAECLWGIVYLAGIWIAFFLLRKNAAKGLLALFCVQVIIIQVAVLHFTPKVEAYSQRAAIKFFKDLQGKDVYVHVLGYKSYAHLFYTRRQPTNVPPYTEEELLTGVIDKPAYFICKITAAERYRSLPQLQKIGEENGFVFFKRL